MPTYLTVLFLILLGSPRSGAQIQSDSFSIKAVISGGKIKLDPTSGAVLSTEIVFTIPNIMGGPYTYAPTTPEELIRTVAVLRSLGGSPIKLEEERAHASDSLAECPKSDVPPEVERGDSSGPFHLFEVLPGELVLAPKEASRAVKIFRPIQLLDAVVKGFKSAVNLNLNCPEKDGQTSISKRGKFLNIMVRRPARLPENCMIIGVER